MTTLRTLFLSDPTAAELETIFAEVKEMWASLIDVTSLVPGYGEAMRQRRELPQIIEHIFAMAAKYAARSKSPLLTIRFCPLLVQGQLGLDDTGVYMLIDSESPEPEQLVTIWHEALHLLGLTDEKQVEALASELANWFPEILPLVKQAHAK